MMNSSVVIAMLDTYEEPDCAMEAAIVKVISLDSIKIIDKWGKQV